MTTAAAPVRGRWFRILLVVLAALCLSEGFVRVRESVLPHPLLWANNEQQLKEAQINDLRARGGASVVAIGSSVADASFNAVELTLPRGARPAYNAAMVGAGMGMTEGWVNLLAVPRLRPDTVILELSSPELNPNDLSQRNDDRAFEASRAMRHLRGTENLMQKTDERVENWSALFRYKSVLREPRNVGRLFGLGATRVGANSEITPTGQVRGFLKGKYDISAPLQAFVHASVLHEFTVGNEQQRLLQRLLIGLKKNVKHVLVVNVPVTQDFIDLHPRGAADYMQAVDVMRTSSERNGYPFLDVGVWPTELFVDPIHLNGQGSSRFMGVLNEELRRLGWYQ